MSFNDHSNGMVWKRSCDESEEDNVWDDRALINAYDRAVNKVNQKIADKLNLNHRNSINKESNSSIDNTINSIVNDWHCGQYCRSVYNEDGIEYESQIISINGQNNRCIVKYVGYGNEEEKSLNELKPSLGKRSRDLQLKQIETQNTNRFDSDTDNEINVFANKMTNDLKANKSTNRIDSSSTSSWFMPSGSTTEPKPLSQPIVPPPLPFLQESDNPNDDESLASMLMSWYMSGYHTGYYKALKQFKHNCKCNK